MTHRVSAGASVPGAQQIGRPRLRMSEAEVREIRKAVERTSQSPPPRVVQDLCIEIELLRLELRDARRDVYRLSRDPE